MRRKRDLQRIFALRHLFYTRLHSESGGAGVLVVFPCEMAPVSAQTELTWKESEPGAGPAGNWWRVICFSEKCILGEQMGL